MKKKEKKNSRKYDLSLGYSKFSLLVPLTVLFTHDLRMIVHPILAVSEIFSFEEV
jgi:hypothetical protein